MIDAIVSLLVLLGMGAVFWVVFALGLAALFVRKNNQPPKNPRHEANLQILAQLLKYADDNPDQRFGQILRNTGVVVDVGVRDSAQQEWETPEYYWMRGIHEEPIATLARMELNKRGIYEEIKVVDKK